MNKTKNFLGILKEFKKGIGWSIVDIKDISSSIFMHKILLEEGANPTRDAQHRLSPIVKEVRKKKVVKWLDIGIIYPISNYEWASPIHSVPKKGGMNIVEN